KTLFNATQNEWDAKAGNFTKRNRNYLQNNRLIHKLQDRALQIIGELQIEKEDSALNDDEKRYRKESNRIQHNDFGLWDDIIEDKQLAGRTGNAQVNKDARHILNLFHNSLKLTFQEITPAFLYKLEVFLRSRGGTDGGIGVKMRAIRALYNFAIERNIV